jgi:hypothetical protein
MRMAYHSLFGRTIDDGASTDQMGMGRRKRPCGRARIGCVRRIWCRLRSHLRASGTSSAARRTSAARSHVARMPSGSATHVAMSQGVCSMLSAVRRMSPIAYRLLHVAHCTIACCSDAYDDLLLGQQAVQHEQQLRRAKALEHHRELDVLRRHSHANAGLFLSQRRGGSSANARLEGYRAA